MELYQIEEITEKFNNAGTKANADVSSVAENMGFKPVYIRMATTERSKIGKIKRQLGYLYDWDQAVKTIPDGSALLMQHPFHHKQLSREKSLYKIKKKGVKIISFIHDVEELRGFRYSEYYKKEFQTMVDLADVFVVHNEKMKQWFIGKGVSEEKLVTLEIFDYLHNNVIEQKVFNKSLTVAGNLDTVKCGYVAELGKLKNIHFNLYGLNYDKKMNIYQNVTYHGEFPMNVIPSKLTEGFGLVWDGSSIDGCQGEAGQYLKYNNPHKLSLYLSSGLPVVIWSGAAEADFVKKQGVGICVDTLMELEERLADFSVSDYVIMCRNAMQLSKELRSGKYAEYALRDALEKIEKPS